MSEESKMKGLLRKLKDLRGIICKCDWKPEGRMTIQGNKIEYISVAQMKANLAPLYAEVGLDICPDMDEPKYISEARCWLVGLTFTTIDTDTGEAQVSHVYGTGEGSKGVAIAISYALKMYLSTKFMLADGIDPDKAGIANIVPSFTPKSQKEKDEIVSKMDEVAAPVEAPANPITSKPAEEQPKPKAAPKAEPKEEDPRGPAPTYSALQGKSIARILGEHVDTPEYDQMKAEAEALRTPADARAFISKYKAN